METSRGLLLVFFTLVLFISITIPLTSSHDVDDKKDDSRLSVDDYRILKAMMDRCVDIFGDPKLHKDDNQQLDVVVGVHLHKLNKARCNEFFHLVDLSFSKYGRISPDCARRLKEEVPNQEKFKPNIGSRVTEQDTVSDARVLKPIMENCVNFYLDPDDDHHPKEQNVVCKKFFDRLYSYYWRKDELSGLEVDILKELPRLFALERDDRGYEYCLIWEKHGRDRNCTRNPQKLPLFCIRWPCFVSVNRNLKYLDYWSYGEMHQCPCAMLEWVQACFVNGYLQRVRIEVVYNHSHDWKRELEDEYAVGYRFGYKVWSVDKKLVAVRCCNFD
ncbi:hypothetical protein ACH5RR_023900 [Cinchona calisaya]|uniref:Uncharacterized protein n=1 Tax=Cinchona calisaya TaxID=153742 RepID=A0ABD2ZD44_9GENT